MPAQSWVALTPPVFWTADGTAYTASTTLTSITPTPDVVLPANFLQVGSRLRITAAGRLSTTSTPTLQFGLYYGGVGGVSLAAISATATVAATNVTFRAQFVMDVRTIGTAGTAMVTGQLEGLVYSATVPTTMIPVSAPATATIDTTAAKALVLGATWGTNNASSLQIHSWLVESLA
jgi:hypothetical protein